MPPSDSTVQLSILVPFHGDDPSPLIRSLAMCYHEPGTVELILHNDGCPFPHVLDLVELALRDWAGPYRIIGGPQNRGRSEARNALTNAACAPYILFLDADMVPDAKSFLQAYLNLIKQEAPAIAFGGFSVSQAPKMPKTHLHRALAQASDSKPARERKRSPAATLCTSNLLVRRDVLEAFPFDTGFCGWGWEDVEWAARASSRFPINHIDNTATHLGLQDANILLGKFATSASNFARLVTAHPTLAQTMPVFRTARLLRRVDCIRRFRPLLERVVRAEHMPVRLRVLAIKLWRASWYAEALP
jgi:hypothetical protein